MRPIADRATPGRATTGQPSIVWQPPGWSPQGAVDFLHALAAEDAGRLATWAQGEPHAQWATWLEAQGLAPLAFHRLRAAGLAGRPTQVADALRASYYTAAAYHTLLSAALRDLLAELHPLGIRPIALKGMVLSSALYPAPATRPTSDLDLLIEQSQVAVVKQVLLGQGYVDLLDLGTEEHLAFANHLHMQRKPGSGQAVSVEAHWHLVHNPGYVELMDVDQVRARAQPADLDGCAALVPEPADQLLHACAHLLLHHGQNPRLIWLLDLRMLTLRYGQAWDWWALIDRARAMHLAAGLRYWLEQTEGWFGAFLPEAAHHALAAVQPTEDEASYIAAAQAGDQQVWETYWRRMSGAAGWRRRLAFVNDAFLPPWSYMQQRYGARSRWLAPLYYGWRFIRAGLVAFRRSG